MLTASLLPWCDLYLLLLLFSNFSVSISDIDGCAEPHCFPGVTCTDVKAPGIGFTCGSCPPGYQGNGIKCQRTEEL